MQQEKITHHGINTRNKLAFIFDLKILFLIFITITHKICLN